MQLNKLINELIKIYGDDTHATEVYLYVWNNVEHKAESVPVTQIQLDNDCKVYLLGDNWPECMVGGHDDGCMCNLGFTPRWR